MTDGSFCVTRKYERLSDRSRRVLWAIHEPLEMEDLAAKRGEFRVVSPQAQT